MFVVTVTFKVHPGFGEAFLARVLRQAADSLTLETECHIFDVCANDQEPETVFLYEVYENEASFKAHLASSHFRAFDQEVGEWIADKQVRTYQRQGIAG